MGLARDALNASWAHARDSPSESRARGRTRTARGRPSRSSPPLERRDDSPATRSRPNRSSSLGRLLPPIVPLRIGHLNIGGVSYSEEYLINTIIDGGYDIFLISESKNSDHAYWTGFRSRTGWTALVVSRPRTPGADGHFTLEHGGVALICTSPSTIGIRDVHHDDRGVLAAEVHSKTGTWRPLCILHAYLPPRGSPHARHNEELIALLAHLCRRARAVYGNEILLTGDHNYRLGCLSPTGRARYSFDKKRDAIAPYLDFLVACELAPLAGRSWYQFAPTTSRSISCTADGVAEVDYIMGHTSLDPSRYRVIPTPPWSSVPRGVLTHRVIGVTYMPLAVTAAYPEPSSERERRWDTPHYGNSDAWHAVSEHTLRELNARRVAITSITSTATEALSALTEAICSALDTAIPARDQRASAPRERYPATPASVARVATHRVHLAGLRRNVRLPPRVARLVDAARRARRELCRTPLSERLPADAIARARHASNAANHALRALRRQHRTHGRDALSALRKLDAHGFYRDVQRNHAPTDPTFHGASRSVIPDEPGQLCAPQRFEQAFRDLHSDAGPIPRGATDENWLKHIPRHPEPALARPISGDELMPLLFPINRHASTICPSTGGAAPDCPLCAHHAHLKREWSGPHDLEHEQPEYSPTGNTAAATHGELNLRHLRWARPKNARHLWPYRQTVCDYIAAVLAKVQLDEAMPEPMVSYRSIPIGKHAKKGIVWNKADPKEGYRYLAMCGLITKILGLAITARLTHWNARFRVTDVSHQGAFTPLVGGEWHPWAAIDAVRAEWRENRDVFLLFVDFRKAYDMVHPEALMRVLERSGVPIALINLLRHWFANRETTLHVNGVAIPGIPVRKGVGQGDTSSCLFFNLFIESLGRYLRSLNLGLGISPAGVVIKSQFFADDVLCPNRSIPLTTATARAIAEWCVAWGMQLSLGQNKTAVMAMFCPRSRRLGRHLEPLPPVTLANGDAIPFTDEYVYLGYSFNPTLTSSDHVSSLRSTMQANYRRYFAHSSVIMTSDLVTKVQLFKSAVVGSINYLLSLVPPTQTNIRDIDATLLDAGRAFLGLPECAPNALVRIESGLPTATGLLARARMHLALSLIHTPHRTAPAAELFRALSAQQIPSTRESITSSWVHQTTRYLLEWRDDGSCILETASLRDVKRVSGVFGRAVSNNDLLTHALPSHVRLNVTSASQRPAASPPMQCVSDMAFGFIRDTSALGGARGATPMSQRGVQCSGSGLSLTTICLSKQQLYALSRARLGALCLCIWPLAPAAWLLPARGPHGDWHEASNGRLCPLCDYNSIADPWHILNECTYPAVVAHRALLRHRALRYIPVLVGHIVRAQSGYDAEREHAAAHAATSISAAIASLDWDNPTSAFLLHRLVLVLPWPASRVDDASALVTLGLGQLFDATVVPNSRIHATYNSWTSWGSKALIHSVRVWADAVDALPHP